jgi:hypothetical protein
MNRELLEKPFTPDQIKQREGNFGKMLDYIEGKRCHILEGKRCHILNCEFNNKYYNHKS